MVDGWMDRWKDLWTDGFMCGWRVMVGCPKGDLSFILKGQAVRDIEPELLIRVRLETGIKLSLESNVFL